MNGDADRIHWNEIVAEGIEARKQHDGAQWLLGDLALEVETSYGGGELRKYAVEIGIGHSALQEYRRVAGLYEKSTRMDNLSWSHHRIAGAFTGRDDWLRQAHEQQWSSREMLSAMAATHEGGDAKIKALNREQDKAIEEDDQEALKALGVQGGPFDQRYQAAKALNLIVKQAGDFALPDDADKGGWLLESSQLEAEVWRLLTKATKGIRHVRPDDGWRITCSVEECQRNAEKQHSLYKHWRCEQGHTIWMRVCEIHYRASTKAKKADGPMPSWVHCSECERESAKTDEERAADEERRARNLAARRQEDLYNLWGHVAGVFHTRFRKDTPPNEAAERLNEFLKHERDKASSPATPEDLDDFFPTLKRFADWLAFVCDAAEKTEVLV